jgi:hypothetical protein
MLSVVTTLVQILAISLISLVAGSTFGIWQGYNPHGFSPATFVEVHQGAVRGLNVLLPGIAMAGLVLTVVLAFMSRERPVALSLYVIAIAGFIAGGVITRFANQPINAQVMTWTTDALPPDWTAIRDTWWHWHVVRMVVSVLTEVALIAAVFSQRSA